MYLLDTNLCIFTIENEPAALRPDGKRRGYTAKIAQESSVRLIVDTARNQKSLELREYNTLKSLTVDKILLQTVEKVLQTGS